MTILEKYSRKSPMVLHAPMQRQTFEESGCFEVGTYLKREMSTSDPAFHSHSSRTSPGPTPAVPGCPGEGAGEGTAEEETWPCQQRGDGCTYCGEGVLCGQCVCVWGGSVRQECTSLSPGIQRQKVAVVMAAAEWT